MRILSVRPESLVIIKFDTQGATVGRSSTT